MSEEEPDLNVVRQTNDGRWKVDGKEVVAIDDPRISIVFVTRHDPRDER